MAAAAKLDLAYQVYQLPQREFYPVNAGSPQMKDLTAIFERVLVPLYGSQEKALCQIGKAKDRIGFLLYEGKIPAGVIVFKTILSDEFAQYGIKDSIEIKSLFVVESEQNSGRGIGSILLRKVVDEANKLKLNHTSIHVTVSETKQESLNFFRKKGFRIMATWRDLYIKGVAEHLLSCAAADLNALFLENQEGGKRAAALVDRVNKLSLDIAERKEEQGIQQLKQQGYKVVRVVASAHWDDIHALKLLPDNTFVSGSKDNTLRKWSLDGKLIRDVHEVEPMESDSKDWITAVDVLNDEYWISGDRSGRVRLWNTAGDLIRDLKPKLPKLGQHYSQAENQRRVNCLAAGVNKQKLSFFIGFPTMFDEFSLIEGRTVCSTKVHNNDWVYCIKPLTDTSILAVRAGTLNTWEKSNNVWKCTSTLINERKRTKKTRQHISALVRLDANPQQYGVGIFEGYVGVVDISKGQMVHEWREHHGKNHSGRVWAIENVSRETFASSGEDGLIKLWDTRLNKSALTIGDHVGEVTSLLRIGENTLVAGSCPKDKNAGNEGAQLVFYDLRN